MPTLATRPLANSSSVRSTTRPGSNTPPPPPSTNPSTGPSTDAQPQAQTHHLTLKGSSKLLTEFFIYALNTILYQRGVYPAEDFAPVKKYGLPILVTTDDAVRAYIRKITSQVREWMVRREVGGLVVVIADKDSGEDVERWEFGVEALGVGQKVGKTGSGQQAVPGTDETKASGGDKENAGAAGGEDREPPKSEEDVQAEIRALFRQITASVTFLPQLDAGSYTFNVLVYADKKSQVPVEWGDSEAREIEGGEKVRLRGFSTDNHRVGTVVSYKVGD